MTERQLPSPRRRYPWEIWTDGEKHTVKRKVDFTSTAASFVAYVHQQARFLGIRAETSTNGDEVTFIFIRPEED